MLDDLIMALKIIPVSPQQSSSGNDIVDGSVLGNNPQEENKEIPVTSVIFVAKTKYSRLARKMKEAEETLSKLTKVDLNEENSIPISFKVATWRK